MNVKVMRQYGSKIGGALGTAIPIIIEEPELIPITSQIGAKAGELAENKIREIYGDSCSCMREILKESEGYSRYEDLKSIIHDLMIRFNCKEF